MAKTRKTKKEKLRAAKRQHSPKVADSAAVDAASIPSSHFTFTAGTTPVQPTQKMPLSKPVVHLREDLLRTTVVTGAIILAEVTLYFILLIK